ncbi:hypothetical protein P0F65_13465 [Sphingomonas sp. I4]
MADVTERLLLQVDAATELLRRHLTEAEQPLDRFERRADRMADNVDRSVSRMGSKFGAFADLADDAAKRAQKSFEASFTQVQRIAAQSVKGPTVDGRADLGVDDLKARASAAQDRARSFDLITAAARRTAAAVGDTTEASRLFIQASEASRIEAEREAAALLSEAGALERVQIELFQSAEAAEHFVGRHQRVAEAAAEAERLAQAEALAARQTRELATQADILRAQIDPMYAAQKRFDDELGRAERLYAAGSITLREYQSAQELARNALQSHAAIASGAAQQERQLALATSAAAQEQRDMAAAVQVLRGALDPMYLAQLRFDQEMDRADDLFRRSAITMREYGAAQQYARDRLYAHAAAIPTASAATQQLTEAQRRAMAAMMGNRMAMQGLSYQAQDTFTQMSMGANVFQVIAIQGAQAAGQLTFLQGEAGSAAARMRTFANFMLGPWGLALTAGLLVLGALTKNLHLFSDEVDDAVAKLQKDAHSTDIAAQAKERFKTTLEGVTQAIRDQAKALDDAAEAERTSAERANIAAKQHAEEALELRKKTAARLADAIAARDGFSATGGGTSTVATVQAAEAARVVELQGQLKDADAQVEKAQANLNRTRVDLAAEQAQIAIDPVRAVTKLYDDRIKALKDLQREEAKHGRQVGAESKRRLQELEEQKKKAVETAQATANAARRSNTANRQFGREVDLSGAREIIASIGAALPAVCAVAPTRSGSTPTGWPGDMRGLSPGPAPARMSGARRSTSPMGRASRSPRSARRSKMRAFACARS